MPRAARKSETADLPVGQAEPRIQSSTGPAGESLKGPTSVEVPERPIDREWLGMVGFSREMITIVVCSSPEKNAEDPVFCGNNGQGPAVDGVPTNWLYREKEYTIERRFVESLLRAKITTFTQRDDTAPDGTKHKINVPHTACRYQIRVVRDDHRRGADWLRAILLEPA